MTTIEQYVDDPDAENDPEPATMKEIAMGEALRLFDRSHKLDPEAYGRACTKCGDGESGYPCSSLREMWVALGIDGREES